MISFALPYPIFAIVTVIMTSSPTFGSSFKVVWVISNFGKGKVGVGDGVGERVGIGDGEGVGVTGVGVGDGVGDGVGVDVIVGVGVGVGVTVGVGDGVGVGVGGKVPLINSGKWSIVTDCVVSSIQVL